MPPVAVAFAAVAAGTATAAMVATVVTTIGFGLTVVGKITGNEAMMKVGGIMSLVGGVGSLAAGAMSAAGAASATEGLTVAAESASSLAAETATTGAMDMGTGFGDGGMSVWDKVSQGTDGLAAGGAMDAAANGIDATGGATPNAPIGEPATVTQPSFSDARFDANNTGLLNPSNMAGTVPDELSIGKIAESDNSSLLQTAVNSKPDTGPGWLKTWWDGLDSTTKNGVMQTGGKAAEGLFNGWSSEQKMEFEREKYNLFNSNANAQPIVAFKPITQPRPVGGLLNTQRG